MKRHQFILSKLKTLVYDQHLIAIKPIEILCSSAFCPAVKAGKALYFDDDHLSNAGATAIIETLDLE